MMNLQDSVSNFKIEIFILDPILFPVLNYHQHSAIDTDMLMGMSCHCLFSF